MKTNRSIGAVSLGTIRVLCCIGCTVATGCGSGLEDVAASRALTVSECGADSNPNAELITLDWEGGYTALYPEESFAAIDLALFETINGGTLADDAEGFKESVRREITNIFCESTATPLRIIQAEGATQPGDTIVHITQALSQRNALEVGEAEYDPCNDQHDNTAVVYGEQIRELAQTASFDEWVSIFANVAAHEIAHTLGYNHIDRNEFASAQRATFVELMLDGHTVSQLRSTQRIMVEQEVCP